MNEILTIKANDLHLITVGKLKDQALKSIEEEYLKRIISPRLLIYESKAYREDVVREGEGVLKRIHEISDGIKAKVILLGEKGELFDSESFSSFIFDLLEKRLNNNKIFFVVAGSHGASKQLVESAQKIISLSPLTFPHQLARIIFIEQIYRSQTIHLRQPYHH